MDIVSAILFDGYNRQHIVLNFSKSRSVLEMKLYSYFTVDIVITKSVKISVGPPFIAGFHCHAIKIKIENHSLNEVKKLTRYRP